MESTEQYLSGGSAESSETPQAAAETTNLTDAGAVTPESQSAATEGDAETEATSQEGAEGATEEKKSHQKTLEERAEEIADRKIQQRIAEAQATAEAQRKAEQQAQPDYMVIDQNAYDKHIAKLITTERQIQDELSMEPEDPVALVRALRKVQQDRFILEQDFNQNEIKRAEWERKNQITTQEQAFFQQTQQEIVNAVNNLPKIYNITPEAVAAGQAYVNNAFQKDPALQQRFNSIVTHKSMYQGFSGVQAAVDWAISYASENMGKAQTAARDQKETGKAATIGASGEGTTGYHISSYADLMKLPSNKINEFVRLNPQKFDNLKQRHFK